MSTDDPAVTGTDDELATILEGVYVRSEVWDEYNPAGPDVVAKLLAWRDGALAAGQERIIAMLERAAAGRREYAGPESNQSEASVLLRKGAACHEFDVKLIRDPTLILDVIPSWRWTAEEEASIREVPDA